MPEHSSWFDFLLPQLGLWRTQLQDRLGTSYLNHGDISLQYVAGFAAVALFVMLLVLSARSRLVDVEHALIPDDRLTVRTFFELMTETILGMMEGMMTRSQAVFFLPLIGTCGLMILFSNLLGLIPGFEAATGNLNTTMAMALIIFLVTHIYGVREHGIGYLAHFFGPIRKWYALPLMILMFGIEIVSHLARPLSLSIRLMGNMFADHKVLTLFTLMVPFVLPMPLLIMGLLVCVVQVAVFCILSMVYISIAVAPPEEH